MVGLTIIAAMAGAVVAPAQESPRPITLTAESSVAAALPTVAVAVETAIEAKSARLTFTLSRPVEAKAFLLERPDRVIVDLPEVNFQLPPDAGRQRRGLVSSFRYGLFAPGRSRIVIDLAEPALVARAASTEDGAVASLTIELTRTDRATYRKAALKPTAEPAEAPAAAPPSAVPVDAAAAAKPLIVLDPGHGGVDPGASGPGGVVEKDVVFAFAQRLRNKLEATGRYRILMTRDTDTFISLGRRVRIARDAKADLFVSIHADTLSDNPDVRGATVYTGSDFASDAEAARLADKENRADQIAGVEAQEDAEDVVGILLDLTKRETRAFSTDFARKLVASLQSAVKLNKNPHRSAGFQVLKAPDVPSILLELGYLSSAKDADLLTSESWRDRSTEALTAAIDRYFSTRLAGQPVAPVSP
ncbi:N-acetylmuramoyl-L-alanine amidase [Chelatococcus sp. SYSU_G07232]|uniref:N-acetylmuramoyl-L-alanine amidase n=2 Tax=Chelatococcus albus TaxID=3047466 RepID=A0ABT7ABF9_9HYPH|nr:N-acetylmuramoyl-L-alanine amidase [Chelatococcus sp. SYSU_G07232]MDJ1156708.1 N-acetylmuramoyl-L-alanine amidase [Chelatococcus sp. SYSU_G07232]